MEECKELFQSRNQKSIKKAVEALREKLGVKQERIKEVASEITEEEGRKMVEIIEKKVICYNKCRKMFSKSNQSAHSKTPSNSFSR
ncbi:hypothetical protein NEMIN01_1196 [Nematocida minor]|uniref:uncharacterized protein n=1 Tax=Nematocida minor TaxID=1912983 RepID=UPI00221EB16E|nr:uncharacterized protein NEMIN01_1196 [Nematocida minor]KAI5190794.1 hypothetical protein NEMIN01_1196 [Nematocida minor]